MEKKQPLYMQGLLFVGWPGRPDPVPCRRLCRRDDTG